MSFRNRLTLFFVLIVVVPMVAVAFVLFRLIENNEEGKADARLSAARTLSTNLYQDLKQRARHRGGCRRRRAGGGAARRRQGGTRAARPAALDDEGASRVVILREDEVLTDVGERDAIAPYS